MPVGAPAPLIQQRSLWLDIYKRFSQCTSAQLSLVLLLLMLVLISFAPMLSEYNFSEIDWDNLSTPPSLENGHFFGTDYLGRDLFVRTLKGGRISLLIGVVGALIAMMVGTLYGAFSGYIGGKTDFLMMRLIEILQSIPFMFLIILLVTFFDRSLLLLFVALGAVSWLEIARIIRGQTLSLKEKEFIQAARVGGASTTQILFTHLIPNLIGIAVVYTSLLVPQMILMESALSFLGLGVQEPMSSWGTLIFDGSQAMDIAPWQLMFPSSLLVITLLCFNFVGDGLRDAIDPRECQL